MYWTVRPAVCVCLFVRLFGHFCVQWHHFHMYNNINGFFSVLKSGCAYYLIWFDRSTNSWATLDIWFMYWLHKAYQLRYCFNCNNSPSVCTGLILYFRLVFFFPFRSEMPLLCLLLWQHISVCSVHNMLLIKWNGNVLLIAN